MKFFPPADGNFFSKEAIDQYRQNKPTRQQKFANASRQFHKDTIKKRAEDREKYEEVHGPIQAGFGATYTHTFNEDSEGDGSNLDYNA